MEVMAFADMLTQATLMDKLLLLVAKGLIAGMCVSLKERLI